MERVKAILSQPGLGSYQKKAEPRGVPFLSLSWGAKVMPSECHVEGTFLPASSARVGRKSEGSISSEFTADFIWPGQFAIKGTRIPL